jgi:hypothetical protein
LNSHGNAGLLDCTLQREGVHQSAKHAHLVGDCTVNTAFGRERFTANKVSAAYNDADFVTGRMDASDFLGNVLEYMRI